MNVHKAEHLSKDKQVRLGGYYTPEKLVGMVYNFIQPYLINRNNKIIIFDSAGGCGAFLISINGYDYRIADYDAKACEFLKTRFDRNKIFRTNSLIDVKRDKYAIPSDAFLVMVGNPPYNDTTSEFRSGEKGRNLCDNDLRDRDLGISFLRSYDKLNADIVCVLHPLSYLIKEANFKRLRDFKEKYRLVRAEIFSSALFSGTGYGKFPVLVALYERNAKGMTYDYVRKFRFNIMDSNRFFVLADYKTTDGYINKYPPRKDDIKRSPIGIYYYTFRDLNSLKKNTSFMAKQHYNGIVVTVENFYKYSYLYSLKSLFNPKDLWLYGNLSPLVDVQELEREKELYVSYTIKTNRIFREIENSIPKKIANFYNVQIDNSDIDKIEKTIRNRLDKLV